MEGPGGDTAEPELLPGTGNPWEGATGTARGGARAPADLVAAPASPRRQRPETVGRGQRLQQKPGASLAPSPEPRSPPAAGRGPRTPAPACGLRRRGSLRSGVSGSGTY